ncbi:MAG: hypothetical protein HKN25_11220, partial [Pyrinomonadaceae bacterium]|nr:hypothetical protein [Pyrinomonadaceae bacterium]
MNQMGIGKILSVTIWMIFVTVLVVQAQSGIKFSTESEIKDDVEKVVCKNSERLDAVKKLFVSKGADETKVKIDDFNFVKNLVVEKPGKTQETVVIGAHYD